MPRYLKLSYCVLLYRRKATSLNIIFSYYRMLRIMIMCSLNSLNSACNFLITVFHYGKNSFYYHKNCTSIINYGRRDHAEAIGVHYMVVRNIKWRNIIILRRKKWSLPYYTAVYLSPEMIAEMTIKANLKISFRCENLIFILIIYLYYHYLFLWTKLY